MMDVKIDVLETEDQAVLVTATAQGYLGTEHFDKKLTMKQVYAEGFSAEELISDISIELALKYKEKYGVKCWISSVKIEDEERADYEEPEVDCEDDIPDECIWSDEDYEVEEKLKEVGDEAFWEVACKVLADSYRRKLSYEA